MARLSTVQRRLLVVVLAAPLLGLIGVIGAEAVPDGRIADHLVDAQQENLIPMPARPSSPLNTVYPPPAECLAFSVGLDDQPGRNHVTTAIVSPVYRSCARLHRALDVYSASGTLPRGEDYLRYWHGYTVLTRPALGLFGVAGARWIAFALVAVAVSAMAVAVGRAHGVAVTAVLVAPTLLTTDTIISGLTAALAIAMASAWAGGWMSFTVVSRRPSATSAALVAALAGALAAYLDLMTVMPGALALTVVGASLGAIPANPDAALRQGWRVAAAAAAGWVGGLAWMWGSKWVIAAITVGVDEVADNVRARVDLWVGGRFGREVDHSLGAGLMDNLRVWWGRPLTGWVVLAICLVLAVAAVRGGRNIGAAATTALCAAIAVVPALGWYLVLNTHSQVHAAFLDRSLGMAFGGAAALLYVGLTAGVRQAPGPAPSASALASSGHPIGTATDVDTTPVQAGVSRP